MGPGHPGVPAKGSHLSVHTVDIYIYTITHLQRKHNWNFEDGNANGGLQPLVKCLERSIRRRKIEQNIAPLERQRSQNGIYSSRCIFNQNNVLAGCVDIARNHVANSDLVAAIARRAVDPILCEGQRHNKHTVTSMFPSSCTVYACWASTTRRGVAPYAPWFMFVKFG